MLARVLLVVSLALSVGCGPKRVAVESVRLVPVEQAPMDEEVSFEAAGVTVRGTLTRPPTAGPWPGLVLVAGSGPTDRDWNSPMVPGENGSGRLLAHAMAQRGVAVVRYDKRASGETPMAGDLHWNDYLEEIRGALTVLRETEGVAAEYLFVAGHSEGGFHVLRLLDDPLPQGLRGAMLLATPGRRYIDLIASQLGEGMALQGKSEAEVSAMKDELIELVRDDGAHDAEEGSFPRRFLEVSRSRLFP